MRDAVSANTGTGGAALLIDAVSAVRTESISGSSSWLPASATRGCATVAAPPASATRQLRRETPRAS